MFRLCVRRDVGVTHEVCLTKEALTRLAFYPRETSHNTNVFSLSDACFRCNIIQVANKSPICTSSYVNLQATMRCLVLVLVVSFLVVDLARGDFLLTSYPTLALGSGDGLTGISPSATLYPQSAEGSAFSFCPEVPAAVYGNPSTTGTCVPVPRVASCLSASEIQSALPPSVFASLAPRFDVVLKLTTQEAPITNAYTEILRILLTEVMVSGVGVGG